MILPIIYTNEANSLPPYSGQYFPFPATLVFFIGFITNSHIKYFIFIYVSISLHKYIIFTMVEIKKNKFCFLEQLRFTEKFRDSKYKRHQYSPYSTFLLLALNTIHLL